MKPKLIFIFSLPRSGSTWLQRIISSHPNVATTAEPWLLLPVLSATKQQFGIQPYGHDLCLLGIKDALSHSNSTNDWKECYFSGVEAMANKIYSDLSGKHAFFLDKTPRYSLISEEIIKTFPGSKFIFLWRHPFSIVSSIQKTWGEKWVVNNYEIDLYQGLFNLIKSHEIYKEIAFSLRYEDLCIKPEETFSNLSKYLGIELPIDFLEKAALNHIEGNMGDPNQYKKDGGTSNPDWKKTGEIFCVNRFRKQWLYNYLKCIGAKRMSQMGYDYYESIQIINNISISSLGINDYYFDKITQLKKYFIKYLIK